MEHFLVTLCITVEGYEKHVQHLIEATNEKSAAKQAFNNEAHNELEWESEEEAFDDSMRYVLYSVLPVPEDDLEIVRKYII